MSNASSSAEVATPSTRRRSRRRWLLMAVAAVFFTFVMYRVLNPFPDQPYMEIPHGDHVHYVPKDRDRDLSVSDFPTQPPGPNERITRDGRIVPAQ